MASQMHVYRIVAPLGSFLHPVKIHVLTVVHFDTRLSKMHIVALHQQLAQKAAHCAQVIQVRSAS